MNGGRSHIQYIYINRTLQAPGSRLCVSKLSSSPEVWVIMILTGLLGCSKGSLESAGSKINWFYLDFNFFVLFLHFNPKTQQVCGPWGVWQSLSNPGTPHHWTHHLDFSLPDLTTWISQPQGPRKTRPRTPGFLKPMDQEIKDQGQLNQGLRIKHSWKPYLKILSAENSIYIADTKHVRHENI